MLRNPDAMHAFTAEETSMLEPAGPEPSLFPPSLAEQTETQLAMGGAPNRGAGLFIGRVLSGDASGVFGSAYHKLKKLQIDEELNRQQIDAAAARDLANQQAAEPFRPASPVEAAAESLRPSQPVREVPPTPLNIEAVEKGIYGWGDISATGHYAKVADDAEINDDYLRFMTTGHADMDRILAERAANNPNLVDGMIAGVRVVGKGGDDKVPDEGYMYSLIESMGTVVERELHKKNPDEVRTMTLQHLESLADMVGENPDRLKKNFLGGLKIDFSDPYKMAAQMVAAKNLMVSELRVLDKISDEAGTLPDGPLKNHARAMWVRQSELVAQMLAAYKGTATQLSRTMNALRVPNKSDAKLLSRNIDEILEHYGGIENAEAAIGAYRAADEAVDRLELARAFIRKTTWNDAFHEVWINSILSGYFSHTRNVAGAVAVILSDHLETATAAGIQTVSKGAFGKHRDITFGDVQAKMFGQIMSMREALIAAGKAAWYRETPAFLGGGNRFDSPVTQNKHNAFSAEALELSGMWGHFISGVGSILTAGRVPLRALQAEDSFFKVAAYRGSLYESAYRSGRELELKGDALSAHIAQHVFEPPKDSMKVAQDFAEYVTLQTPMAGSAKKWQNAFRGRYARWIVPFFKTPTNGIMYVGERSPFAPAMARYQDAVAQGGAPAIKAKTRMALGYATFIALAIDYEQENITGGLSSSPRVKKAYLRQGIKPYHRRIGDTWYNYNLAEPVSTMVGLVADTMEIIQHPSTDERTAYELVIAVAGAIGYNMSNKTYLASASRFMDAIRNPHQKGGKFFTSYLTSLPVPVSAAVNDIRRLNDDLVRFRLNFLDPIRDRIPGLSDNLKLDRDIWGRETVHHRLYSPYKPNKIDAELNRLGTGLTDAPDHYSAEVEYSPDERDWFHKRAGELALKYITAYMETPGSGFKELQAMSKAGDTLAGVEIKQAFNRELLTARQDAQGELLQLPLAEGLRQEIMRVEMEKMKKYQQLNEGMR